MPLKIRCPNGHLLGIPKKKAGTTVSCPKCGQPVDVPPLESSPDADTPAARLPVDEEKSGTTPPLPDTSEPCYSDPLPPPVQERDEPSRPKAEEKAKKKPEKKAEKKTAKPTPPPPPAFKAKKAEQDKRTKREEKTKATSSSKPKPDRRSKQQPVKRDKSTAGQPAAKESPKPSSGGDSAAIKRTEKKAEQSEEKAKTKAEEPAKQPTRQSLEAPPDKKKTPDEKATRQEKPAEQEPTRPQRKKTETDTSSPVTPPPVPPPTATPPPVSAPSAGPTEIADSDDDFSQPGETETPDEQEEAVVGSEPGPRQRQAAWTLGIAVGLLGLVTLVPGIIDIVMHIKTPKSPGVARWAFPILVLGVVQLAYALYLIQLPDWGSVWVVTLALLVLAAMYAALMGILILGGNEHAAVAWLQLQAPSSLNKAKLWCFLFLSLTGLLTYFCGRTSIRWHKYAGGQF